MSAPPTEAQVSEAYMRLYHFSVGTPPDPLKVAQQKTLLDEYNALMKAYNDARAAAAAPAPQIVTYTTAPKPAPAAPTPAPATPVTPSAVNAIRVNLRNGAKDVDAAEILQMDATLATQTQNISVLRTRVNALTLKLLLLAREDVELRQRLNLKSTDPIVVSQAIMTTFRKELQAPSFIKSIKDGTKDFDWLGAPQPNDYLTSINVARNSVLDSASSTSTNPPPSPTQVPGPGVPEEAASLEQEDTSSAAAELAVIKLNKGSAVADPQFIAGAVTLTDDQKKTAVKIALTDETTPASWFPIRVELANGDIEQRYNDTFKVKKEELASLLVGEARQLMLEAAKKQDPTFIDADLGGEPTWVVDNGNIMIYLATELTDETFRTNIMLFVNAVISTYLRAVQDAGDAFTPSKNVAEYKRFHKRIASALTNTVVPILAAVMDDVKRLSGNSWDGYRSAFAQVVSWFAMKVATGTDYGEDGRVRQSWPAAGVKVGDWFTAAVAGGSRNTLVAPSRMPPVVAALMYDDADDNIVTTFATRSQTLSQTELALMLPLFAIVARDAASEIGFSGGKYTFPVATNTAYGRFFAQFFNSERNKATLVFDRTAMLTDMNGSAKDIAEKTFLAKKPGANGLEIATFGDSKSIATARTFYALAARDLQQLLLPAIVAHYKEGKQRALAILAAFWAFFIPFKVPGGSTASLFERLARRPKLTLNDNDKDDITTIKSATAARDYMIKTDAFADRFRSKLSVAITSSKYSTGASRFIEDAKTIVDAKSGKTLFEILDDASASRQYSVFIPENNYWAALQARVPDASARMRLLKRHVVWGSAPYDFSKMDTRFTPYATLLSIDDVTDSDGSILLATVKIGRKNKQTGLLVKYPNHSHTDEIEIISEPSRAKTGRPYFIAGVFWLDAVGLAPSVGAYQALPPMPQPLPPPPPLPGSDKTQYVPMQQIQTTTKPQSKLSDQEKGDIQREVIDLLRKTGTRDALLALSAQSEDDVVVFLPPRAALAAFYATKPSAEDARNAALYHVITTKDFLQALSACVDQKKSLRIATAAGPPLKFACGEKKAKPGRVLASDIATGQWARVEMSGFPNSVIVYRVGEILRPKAAAALMIVPGPKLEEVELRARRLLVASDAADAIKTRAAEANVALLLPPEDKVRALIGSDIADDALRNAVLSHAVLATDLENAVASAQGATIAALSGATIAIGNDAVPLACFAEKKRYVVAAFENSSQTIAVYLVPDIVASTAASSIVSTSCHVGNAPASPEANAARDLTALEQKARTALTAAETPAQASAALDELSASFRALGGPDAIRKLYTEAEYFAMLTRIRDAVNANLRLSSDEKSSVLNGALFMATAI